MRLPLIVHYVRLAWLLHAVLLYFQAFFVFHFELIVEILGLLQQIVHNTGRELCWSGCGVDRARCMCAHCAYDLVLVVHFASNHQVLTQKGSQSKKIQSKIKFFFSRFSKKEAKIWLHKDSACYCWILNYWKETDSLSKIIYLNLEKKKTKIVEYLLHWGRKKRRDEDLVFTLDQTHSKWLWT